MTRGQSHVVGVALMLALTVVALGTITAGVGGMLDAHAATVDAGRVANDLEAALQPVGTTGPRTARIAFSDGRLAIEPRELRILYNGTLERIVTTDSLVFTVGHRRVAFVAGALVRGTGPGAWLRRRPPIRTSADGSVLVIGIAQLKAGDVALSGGGRTALHTNVSHNRSSLGPGTFGVAIESATPEVFTDYFEAEGAETTRRDFDGDGIESVLATYPDSRTAYLVVHKMKLEVGNG